MRIIQPHRLACVMAISMTRGFALEPPVRIMPLGDSLTYGEANTTVQGGYRTRLYNLLTAANYNVDFVGTFSDDPNQGATDRDHQGLARRADRRTPGRASRVVGRGGGSRRGAPADRDQRHLAECSGFPSPDRPAAERHHRGYRHPAAVRQNHRLQPAAAHGHSGYEALQVSYNASIPGIVAQHVALGRQVSFVDMHAVLTPFDLSSDGVHPSTGGYKKWRTCGHRRSRRVISPKAPPTRR